MKKINSYIIVLTMIFTQKLLSQEGVGNGGGSVPAFNGIPCNIPANLSTTNCNLIIYCYDLSGNRIYRFAPNCNPNIGPNSNLGMTAPPQSEKVVAYNMDIIYPNPTTGYAKIDFDKTINDGILRVMTADGKILIDKTFHSNSVDFDLKDYTPGTYYVVVYSKDKNFVKPIIKTNRYENYK